MSKFTPQLFAWSLALVPMSAVGAPIEKGRFEATRRLTTEAVDRLAQAQGGLAGYSVIIAAEGQPDFIKTYGVANAKTGAPVTPSTAFYVASMTKPYTGLIAARLDRERILPVSTPLSAVWPGLRLPAPLDPSTMTFGRLLSHQGGFENDPLGERTAYTDEVPASAYPRLLEEGSKPMAAKFSYTNLGYLIYSAALKVRTGRDWKAHQEELIFRPFGLTQTYTRSSLVPRADLAWGHRWNGSEWLIVQPKNDAIMHAAGGTFVSSRDMARWIRIQLAEGAGANGFTAADFRFTKQKLADQNEGDYGINCDGYALGWHLCGFVGERLFYHGGTYDGVRTHMILVPRLRTGLAVMANSDSQTGNLGFELMASILARLLGHDEDAAKRVAAMTARYPERVRKQVEHRLSRAAASEADASWGGWKWAPNAATLRRYEGIYHNDLWGDVEVRLERGELIAWRGVRRRVLRPAVPDLFGARLDMLDPYTPVSFTAAPGGMTAIKIEGQEYRRVLRPEPAISSPRTDPSPAPARRESPAR
jgi:CubicO group peptidase (beta-lactamase class C family)